MIKNHKHALTILFLISLILSVYLFFRTYVISNDGAFQFIPMAKIFAEGSFEDAISYTGQQPLYPFLIAIVAPWVSDFELAGRLISSFFGILLVFPVYFLGKRMFDQKIAFFSSLFLAVHPYIRRFSADVLKESTYLFFLGTAIWFAWRTLEKDKIYPYLFIPLFSAIAYLNRPDGIEVLLIVFVYILFVKQFSPPARKWVVVLVLVLSSSLLLLPYIFYLKGTVGEWTLSKTKSIAGILGWGVKTNEVPFVDISIYSLQRLNLKIFAVYHPLYLFLLAFGWLRRKFSNVRNEEKFLIFFFIAHYLVLFLLTLNLTDWSADEPSFLMSGRHVLPLLLVSIYWVGDGFLAIFHLVSEKFKSHELFLRLRWERKSARILLALLILMLAIVLPKTLKPQRYERLSEKWAGIWIKNHSGQGNLIFTTTPRVAYYAEGKYEYIDLEEYSFDNIKTSMMAKGAHYLVIRGREEILFPEKVDSIKKNFIEVVRYEEKGLKKIIIYKRIQ